MTKKGQALSVLIVSTLAFTVCFMVWMMFGVIGIPIKKALGLNSTEFGLLTAMPVNELRHGLLAFFSDRTICWPSWRLIFRWYTLCCSMVSEKSTRLCNGHIRCR